MEIYFWTDATRILKGNQIYVMTFGREMIYPLRRMCAAGIG